MGRVTGLAVNEGERVTKGQFLLEIDPRNLRTRVESGEASLQASASQAAADAPRDRNAKLSLKRRRTTSTGSRSCGRAG